MGFQVASQCYSTAEAASSAQASAQAGAVVTHGGAAYVVDSPAHTGASITYQLTPIAGGTALTLVAPYTPQTCGLLEAGDALVMGWGIAAAWLATAALMFLRRGVHE